MENNKTNRPNKNKPEDQANFHFDQAFKNKFKDFENTPPPKVWNAVRKELPLNLYIKRSLNILSKIAAVLLFVMLVSVFLETTQNTKQVAQIDRQKNAPTTTDIQLKNAESPTEPEFVFDLKDQKTMATKTKRKKKHISHSSDLEDLWAEFLEEKFTPEEEELEEQLLMPIETLPLENSIVSLSIIPDIQLYSQEAIPEEIEISIPLKIEANIE